MLILLKRSKSCLNKKNYDGAEIFYAKAKPLFLRLNREQKQEVYPALSDIQNTLVMSQFQNVRKGLLPSKKKR